ISCFFHDAAAALVQDGVVVAAAEEERFSRIKHDAGFPIHAIEFCLRTGKLRGEDLDWVVFYEKPFVKFDRILMSTLATYPRSFRIFRESMIKWLTEKLWVKGLIRKHLGIPSERILFSGHHLSHAASTFYCSPYSEAAILTVDGVGEWATATIGIGRDRNIELLGEIRFPHSLGLLYSVFTAFLGFEVNEGEYKVMGMAPYGEPRYAEDVRKLVRLNDDGVALNSVANGRILRETPFEELFVQPSAGDGGGALGAALYAHHAVLGHPRKFLMEHAYLGEEHSAADIKRFLDEHGVRYEYFEDDDRLIDRVVDALQTGKVIGWSQGRFEWGPRALGNRSILADPRRADMKDIVNTKIKFREPYRPFAPSVLVERAVEYYDLKDPERHYPARFMLLVVDVKEAKRHVVPAPTHVDGTGRLQTVIRETNPRYHRLIETFGKATGVPVVLNTSFNLKGDPIVNTPAEAFSTFNRSGM